MIRISAFSHDSKPNNICHDYINIENEPRSTKQRLAPQIKFHRWLQGYTAATRPALSSVRLLREGHLHDEVDNVEHGAGTASQRGVVQRRVEALLLPH